MRGRVLCALFAGIWCATPSWAEDSDFIARASSAPAGFWDHWGDGQAEIDRYRVEQPRYGEVREGEAVWVFVTEDFTAASNVKSDGGHGDEFPVLKLNDIRHFQTGLYAYSTMTSTFARLDGGLPLGVPNKVSLSVQEWCGHVYEQWSVDNAGLHRTRHSYFDGEADEETELAVPKRAVFADALPIVVRGLTGELVAAGASVDIELLPRGIDTRLGYVSALGWRSATLVRAAAPEQIEVPAGLFETLRTEVRIEGALWMAFDVEVAAPHRVIRWESSFGERGELLATRRSAYWEESAVADEAIWRALLPQP